MPNGSNLLRTLLMLSTLGIMAIGVPGCGSDDGAGGQDAASDTDRTGRSDAIDDAAEDPDAPDGSGDVVEPDAEDTYDVEDTEDGSGDAPLRDADVDDDADAPEVEPTFCPANQRACATPTAFHLCADDGSAWGEATECPDGQFCSVGACFDLECRPEVMFLVDGSSDMESEWPAVRASVARVIAANPNVGYGLSAFPVALGCAIGDGGSGTTWPNVEIASDTLAATAIDEWFEANAPLRGATPITKSFDWFSENADAVWDELSASRYLVLLTNGADTCNLCGEDIDCHVEKLGAATEALLDVGVQTYVIGYRFEASTESLDAIAVAGGTGLETYVPAGDEDTLADAFQLVLDDVKRCGR